MNQLIFKIEDVGQWLVSTDKMMLLYRADATIPDEFMVFQYMNRRADLIENLHKTLTQSGLDLRAWLPEISFLLAEKATEIDPEKTRRRFEKFIRKMEAAMQEAAKTELAFAV